MGRIGIHVTPGEWNPEAGRRPQAKRGLVAQMRTELANAAAMAEAAQPVPTARRERGFDKALAWLSYYSLVFVAFCIFMPGLTQETMAAARDLAAPVLGPAPKAATAMELRGGAGIGAWELRMATDD